MRQITAAHITMQIITPTLKKHDQIGVDEHAQVPNRTNRVHKLAAYGQRKRWQLVLTSNGCNPQHLCLVAVEQELVRSHPAGD
jgi:hypothetical protein